MASRRSVLIGLGSLVAGGGALLGTGAFTTVTAERTVNVETTGDASAFLGLQPARADDQLDLEGDDYAEITDGTLQINIGNSDGGSGLNRNAITRFDNLVLVSNNGSQAVESFTVEFTTVPSEISDNAGADETFNFPVANTDGDEITEGPELAVNGGSTSSPVELLDTDVTPETLNSGDSIVFGLEIDLQNGGNGNNNLPSGGSYELTLNAETSDSS